MTGESYRIGELAQIAGVTVRALHHYDEIGLLVPSERTHGGHRVYTAADVRRLYRLLFLRGLGLPLEEIGTLLETSDGLAATVRRHLDRVEHQLGALEELRLRLARLLSALAADEEPTRPLLDALEAMSMIERYYTPEQLEQLARRREELGAEAIKEVEAEWPRLLAELREHRERGTVPADPAVQALARRAGELTEMFTGGDPGIAASLRRMYEQEGPKAASGGAVDPADIEYLVAARRAGTTRS
jgi:DNA-binding transcriptional MerR regulator